MRRIVATLSLFPAVAVSALAGCQGGGAGSSSASSVAATKAAGTTTTSPASGTPAPAAPVGSSATPAPSSGAAAVLALPPLARSTTGTPSYTVDPSQPQAGTNYTTLSALLAGVTLAPGDIVEISTAFTYSDIVSFSSRHSGASGNPVVIRARPGAGNPFATWDASQMSAAEQQSLTNSGYFWQLDPSSHDIEICGIEIENMPLATAAAGPLRGVYFLGQRGSFHHGFVHNNGSDGFMSAASSIDTRVESSEVSFNGAGDGYTHNFYMEGAGDHIRFNYIHDAQGGINYKDRSVPDPDGIAVDVAYNWIANAVNGGYELDFMGNASFNGGATVTSAYVIGNVVVKAASGNDSFVLNVGGTGGSARYGTVYLANNTIFEASNTASVVDVGSVSAVVATNNIFYGSGALLASGASGPLTGSNNVVDTGVTAPSGVTASIDFTGTAPAPFAAAPTVAVDAGTTQLPLALLAPVFEIAQGTGSALPSARIDGGATCGASAP
jgi:hypothetical protein